MSIPPRILTLIFALGLLSLTGLACGVKTEEVRQLAAEQLEVAAKKLATDSTPAPRTAEKGQDGSIEFSNPEDFPENPQLKPDQTSPDALEKSKDDSITLSNPKGSPDKPQLKPAQTSPDTKGDAATNDSPGGGKQAADADPAAKPKDSGDSSGPPAGDNPQLIGEPAYVPIWVSVGISVMPGFENATVARRVELSLRQHLAPLPPYGPTGNGWPMGREVKGQELMAAASRVEGVAIVNGLFLGCVSGGLLDPVPMMATELPGLADLSVQVGAPQTRAEMLSSPVRSALAKTTTQAPTQQLPKTPAASTPVVPKRS